MTYTCVSIYLMPYILSHLTLCSLTVEMVVARFVFEEEDFVRALEVKTDNISRDWKGMVHCC
ncbi:hypothetical protein Hanom_Chr10g00956141 [Helianthus anomalus]